MPEIKDLLETMQRDVDEFRKRNDARIDALEKGSQDPLLKESVDKLTEKIVALEKQIEDEKKEKARLAAARTAAGEDPEHRAAFGRWVRGAATSEDHGILKTKSVNTVVGSQGGYLVPTQLEIEIRSLFGKSSALYDVARHVAGTSGTYTKARRVGAPTGGHRGEGQSVSVTDAGRYELLTIDAVEVYSRPLITRVAIDDGGVVIEDEVRNAIADELPKLVGDALINGNVPTRPSGLVTYPKIANANWAWGKHGYLITGASGAFATSDPGDVLVDMALTPAAGYLPNCRWMMSTGTLQAVLKLKDGDKQYLWRPGLTESEPSALLGRPVSIDDNMPPIGADSYSIAYGDFARGYLVLDRTGMRVIRNEASEMPDIVLDVAMRYGGGVDDFAAIKFVKFGTS